MTTLAELQADYKAKNDIYLAKKSALDSYIKNNKGKISSVVYDKQISSKISFLNELKKERDKASAAINNFNAATPVAAKPAVAVVAAKPVSAVVAAVPVAAKPAVAAEKLPLTPGLQADGKRYVIRKEDNNDSLTMAYTRGYILTDGNTGKAMTWPDAYKAVVSPLIPKTPTVIINPAGNEKLPLTPGLQADKKRYVIQKADNDNTLNAAIKSGYTLTDGNTGKALTFSEAHNAVAKSVAEKNDYLYNTDILNRPSTGSSGAEAKKGLESAVVAAAAIAVAVVAVGAITGAGAATAGTGAAGATAIATGTGTTAAATGAGVSAISTGTTIATAAAPSLLDQMANTTQKTAAVIQAAQKIEAVTKTPAKQVTAITTPVTNQSTALKMPSMSNLLPFLAAGLLFVAVQNE